MAHGTFSVKPPYGVKYKSKKKNDALLPAFPYAPDSFGAFRFRMSVV